MDPDRIIEQLTVDELASLTAGEGIWTTFPIPRVELPRVRVTDGPNGARGSGLADAPITPALCVPCGSALGATWDPDLVREIGVLLGEQTKTKAGHVLLAPTVNLHRHPLAGRTFESYAEDPYLTGRLAVAFVDGVQSTGVGATVKHLVGNESEFQRATISTEMDERTLREVYLLPFEMAVKEAEVRAVMTAYNRLRGEFCSNQRHVVDTILRGEWGYDGLVMTDWQAGGTTEGAAEGLDLEMPGPGRFLGAHTAGAVPEGVLRERARRVVRLVSRVVDAADPDGTEQAVVTDGDRALLRRTAADATVLLRNDGVLPLGGDERVAVIGPNAAHARIMGGGSAAMWPYTRVAPLEVLRRRFAEVVYEPGCSIDLMAPLLDGTELRAPSGVPGIEVTYTDAAGQELASRVVDRTELMTLGPPEGVTDPFRFVARATWVPDVSGVHRFELLQAGRAVVRVGDEVVCDGREHDATGGTFAWGLAASALHGEVDVEAGAEVPLEISYSSEDAVSVRGVRVGAHDPLGGDPIGRAERAAADADVAVLIVGTSGEHESEGFDRDDWRMPGPQDELVRRVAAVNPRTVVVVNAGAPVAMDWADEVAAVLQVWFGGEEMAEALADVLLGDAEPGGRLPTTIPLRLEHVPAHGNYPGENGRVTYGEGLLVGHRWYDERRLPVRFPFGHGLSYSSFEIGEPRVVSGELPVRVEVPVRNTGDRAGTEVVQCYVRQVSPRLMRPRRELKAFAKVRLEAGASGTAVLELGPRDLAHYDPGEPERQQVFDQLGDLVDAIMKHQDWEPREVPGWYVDAGRYELHIGRSIADLPWVVGLDVGEELGPL